MYIIRPSVDGDVDAISAIYRHYVLTSTATFEIAPPDSDEMARRRRAVIDHGLPYLVAEMDETVVGYAYAGVYRPRHAYRFTVENSIYIRQIDVGKGLGRGLLAKLIEKCEAGPSRQMIAVIGDSANRASIALHESFQFRHVGTLEKVGWKFDRWLDTVLMQRELAGDGRQVL